MSQLQLAEPLAPAAAPAALNPQHFTTNQAVLHKFLPCPLMSVQGVERSPGPAGKRKIIGIRCYWFDANGHYHSEVFHSNSLRAATRAEIPEGFGQPTTASQGA